MQISVIIPAYNAEKTINRCIESVLDETNSEYVLEVIVVDDGSKDSTALVLKEISRKYSKVRVISKCNGGVSSARNVGIKAACAEYILFCDADDELSPNLCKALLEKMVEFDCDLVIGNYKEISGSNQKIHNTDVKYCKSAFFIQEHFNELFFGFYLNVPWCKLFKKAKIKELFDETMQNGEDVKFVLRYLVDSPKCIAVSEPYYIVHTDNQSSLSRNRMTALKGVIKTQQCIYDFVKESHSRIEWATFSDYCISIIWTNIAEGYNNKQFSHMEGYAAIGITDEYIRLMQTFRPRKTVNKLVKTAIIMNKKFYLDVLFRLLSYIKRIR